MNNYETLQMIGRGSYGEAYLVRHRVERQTYVLKRMKLRAATRKEKDSAKLEVSLLSKLLHPNIVAYKESFTTKDETLCIVMAYCEMGDLADYIKKRRGKSIDEYQIVDWITQITMALDFIHSKKVLHRDLKSQNIFLTRNATVKLGDFGIARVMSNTIDLATSFIGTPYYMSPELLQNKPYGKKSDIWALGCILYELMAQTYPFNAQNLPQLTVKVINGVYPAPPVHYSDNLQQLVTKLLLKDASRRPSCRDILAMPFIRSRMDLFLHEIEMENFKNQRPPEPTASPLMKPQVPISKPTPNIVQNPASKAKPPLARNGAPINPRRVDQQMKEEREKIRQQQLQKAAELQKAVEYRKKIEVALHQAKQKKDPTRPSSSNQNTPTPPQPTQNSAAVLPSRQPNRPSVSHLRPRSAFQAQYPPSPSPLPSKAKVDPRKPVIAEAPKAHIPGNDHTSVLYKKQQKQNTDFASPPTRPPIKSESPPQQRRAAWAIPENPLDLEIVGHAIEDPAVGLKPRDPVPIPSEQPSFFSPRINGADLVSDSVEDLEMALETQTHKITVIEKELEESAVVLSKQESEVEFRLVIDLYQSHLNFEDGLFSREDDEDDEESCGERPNVRGGAVPPDPLEAVSIDEDVDGCKDSSDDSSDELSMPGPGPLADRIRKLEEMCRKGLGDQCFQQSISILRLDGEFSEEHIEKVLKSHGASKKVAMKLSPFIQTMLFCEASLCEED
eukprot:TRINITY_DN8861_c0_g1_i2.p1 TRINITY_DN8861_c0_g1~~TRINITY_DN8861_c0_g1_i2.p1  ORF type:complete len:729 (-),score=152.74 TRINITY_DN8861_c0_g1_i2:319-2505(-)